MKKLSILVLLLLSGVFITTHVQAQDNRIPYTEADYERLSSVIQYVENVLKYGHEYNTETQLLPDAINTLTGEPAKWTFPNRAEVPYANLANQQNFFRTLVGLSKVTGSPKYKQEAVDILSEFMRDYQSH